MLLHPSSPSPHSLQSRYKEGSLHPFEQQNTLWRLSKRIFTFRPSLLTSPGRKLHTFPALFIQPHEVKFLADSLLVSCPAGYPSRDYSSEGKNHIRDGFWTHGTVGERRQTPVGCDAPHLRPGGVLGHPNGQRRRQRRGFLGRSCRPRRKRIPIRIRPHGSVHECPVGRDATQVKEALCSPCHDL